MLRASADSPLHRPRWPRPPGARRLISRLSILAAVFSAALTILAPASARADAYPQTQNMEVGGIDLNQYCQTTYGTHASWWVQIFANDQITVFPYLDGGKGPNAAYDWKCMLVSASYGMSDAGTESYEAAMAAWDPSDGPEPDLSDYAGINIDSYDGLPVDMNQACRQQHGTGAFAILGNASDVRSWKCYVQVLTDFANMA
jgi:hypothetical protein